MQCTACFYTLPEGASQCPRCNCPHYPIGNSPEDIAFAKRLAEKHRSSILQELDYGVVVYRWKDVDGNIFLDSKFRLSFGTGDRLLNHQTWLVDKFARVPEEKELLLELSIYKSRSPHYSMPVSIPVPQEPQLLQLGIEIHDNLTVSLFLKNQDSITQSAPVDFMIT